MKTLDLVRRYFEEQFFIIPILKSSKVPLEKKWNEKPLQYNDTLDFLRLGYNIGIVGGYQSRKDERDLVILDFDGRLDNKKISDNLDRWRSLNTVVQFTPHGFHIFLRTKERDREVVESLSKNYCKEHNVRIIPHRTTYDPKHTDNTFDGITQEEHDKYFESMRWNSMYVVACPSMVGNKSYWFLDDMKGEILEI
jgi:hypothetical protein